MFLNARNNTSWVGFHAETTTELLARDLLMTDITYHLALEKEVAKTNQASGDPPETLPSWTTADNDTCWEDA